jgi:hypothetical protein
MPCCKRPYINFVLLVINHVQFFKRGRCVCQLEIWVVMVSKEPSALCPSESVSQLTKQVKYQTPTWSRNPQTHMSNSLDKWVSESSEYLLYTYKLYLTNTSGCMHACLLWSSSVSLSELILGHLHPHPPLFGPLPMFITCNLKS